MHAAGLKTLFNACVVLLYDWTEVGRLNPAGPDLGGPGGPRAQAFHQQGSPTKPLNF